MMKKVNGMEIADYVIKILWIISMIFWDILLAWSLMSDLDSSDVVLKIVALFNCAIVLFAVFSLFLFAIKEKLQEFFGNLVLILFGIITVEYLLVAVFKIVEIIKIIIR